MIRRLTRLTDHYVAPAAPYLVLLLGVLSMLSWKLDIPAMRGQWNPESEVSMKWATASTFGALGLSHLLLRHRHRANIGQACELVAGGVAGGIAAILSVLLFSALSGTAYLAVQVGITEGDPVQFQTVAPGVPSVGTMIAGAVIGAWTFISAMSTKLSARLRALPILVGLAGGVALAGHTLGVHAMYYHWPETSTAMAKGTATLFVLLAASARGLVEEEAE